jgi:hypothetical protein
MNRGAVLVGALLMTLATPATWPAALATFLIRGGIVLFLFPIVVLPSPVGLANGLGPTVTSIAFGSVSPTVLAAGIAIVFGVVLVLVLAGWLAAALEGEGVNLVAADEELVGFRVLPVRPITRHLAARILAVRLVANVPLGFALGWGSVRLVDLTYRELTSPSDVTTPIVGRVVLGAPDVVAAIVLTWMFGQIIGAIAVRRIVLSGVSPAVALRTTISTAVRHPLASLARFWIPTLALLAVLIPSSMAAGAAWGAVAAALRDPVDAAGIVLATLIFVALWMIGLLLTGVVCAWRSAIWTVARVAEEGTFGGWVGSRPGDWRDEGSSAKV